MSLRWDSLSFTTTQPILQKCVSLFCCGLLCQCPHRRILNGIHGLVHLGELVAIMGPSGSGKTSLLNCLTRGINQPGFEGKIFVSGIEDANIRASFISQDEKEHLLSSLTVKESLLYASQLKNSPSTTRAEHEAIVNRLVGELGLGGSENILVDNVSGGQKKRLSIGLELTGKEKPHFLFLDEPTSGLDSFVGLKVIQLLENLARSHKMSIITTIHQPSFRLFTLFAKVYILTGSGETFYAGSPLALKEILLQHGYQEEWDNPADVALELANTINRGDAHDGFENCGFEMKEEAVVEKSSTEVDLEEEPHRGKYRQFCETMIGQYKNPEQEIDLENPLKPRQIESTGLCVNDKEFLSKSEFQNLRVLLYRTFWTSVWKQKKFTAIKIGLHIAIATVLATLYSRDIGKDPGCALLDPEWDAGTCACIQTEEEMRSESTITSNIKFHFFSLLFLMFGSMMPTVLTFPQEIKLFSNEYRNGWYSVGSYYISKTLCEVPLQLLIPYVYTSFLYWYTGQPDFDYWHGGFTSFRYGHFLLCTLLCGFIAQGIGFLIGITCVRSFNISIVVGSSILLFLFLFSGFFVKRILMSDAVDFVTYFSFVRFALDSFFILIYGRGQCEAPMKSSVLVIYGLDESDFWTNYIGLFVHLVVVRVLAFLLLYQRAAGGCFRASRRRWFKCSWLDEGLDCLLKKMEKLHPMLNSLSAWGYNLLRFVCLLLVVQIVIGVLIGVYHAIW